MSTPNVQNYALGKGVVKFDRFDTDGLPTGLRHLGNAPALALAVAIEKLDHFSSMEGVRKKDHSVVLTQGATVKFTLDEYAAENLALAVFGTLTGGVINLLDSSQIEGELHFIGNSSVGPNYYLKLWRVSLKPTGDLSMIAETDWAKIEFEGEVLQDITGHPSQPYGTMERITSGS